MGAVNEEEEPMGEEIELVTSEGKTVRVSLWGALATIARHLLKDPFIGHWTGSVHLDGKHVDISFDVESPKASEG